MRTAARFTMTLIAALIAAVVLLLQAPTLVGAIPLTVLSGSMAPAYRPGDAVIVQPVRGAEEASQLQVGDVITFMPEPEDLTTVTHRIVGVGVTGDGIQTFQTKGDANESPVAFEYPITHAQIVGRVAYSIPLVGWVMNALGPEAKHLGRQLVLAAVISYAIWHTALAGRQAIRSRRSTLMPEEAHS